MLSLGSLLQRAAGLVALGPLWILEIDVVGHRCAGAGYVGVMTGVLLAARFDTDAPVNFAGVFNELVGG